MFKVRRSKDPNRISLVNRRMKRQYDREGVRFCEACGWTVPPGIFNICLIIHHIIPLCLGGPLGDMGNTALLCPNHAAVGDALAAQSLDARGNYLGPKNRKDLFEAFEKLDRKRDRPFILRKAASAMEGLNADVDK